jgi:hypothetical protein
MPSPQISVEISDLQMDAWQQMRAHYTPRRATDMKDKDGLGCKVWG